MKTNAKITKQAFKDWFDTYMSWRNHEQSIDELALIFENNDGNYYNNFIQLRRVKAHSAAFYSVILAVKPFLPKGYYASNAQIKANIQAFFGMDYKEFLAPLVEYLEDSRNEFLSEN